MPKLTTIGKELGKICWDPGHYAGANKIPKQYATTVPRKAFSEGDNNLTTVLQLVKEIPGSFSTRKDGKDKTFAARADIADAGGADTEISFHSNWSVGSKTKQPNHGTVRVIRSLLRPADQALGLKIAQAIAAAFPELKLKAVCDTRESATSPGKDYYGMLRNPVARGLKHAFIVEHGYHVDWCDYMPIEEFRRRVVAAWEKLIYVPEEAPVTPPVTPTKPTTPTTNYLQYTVQKGDSPWKVAVKYKMPGADFVKIKFAKTGVNLTASDMIYAGQVLLIPTGNVAYIEYTVKNGDTPWGIATAHKLPGAEFVQIKDAETGKNLTKTSVINPGQKLLVPKK